MGTETQKPLTEWMNCRVKIELHEALLAIKAETGKSIYFMLNEAISEYINKHNEPTTKPSGTSL